MAPRDLPDGFHLPDYLAILRRRIRVVLIVPCVVLLVALFLSLFQDPVYASKGRLLVTQSGSVFGTGEQPNDPEFVTTAIQILESEEVRARARDTLGSAPPVSAVQVGTTSVVEVVAEGNSPERAAAIVDTYMQSYLDFQRERASESLRNTSRQVQDTVDELQAQIDALNEQLLAFDCPTGDCPERSAVEQARDARIAEQIPFRQKLSQLTIEVGAIDVGAVVTPAAVNDDPVRPKPVRNGAVALVVGTMLGMALAVLFEYRDDSIRDGHDVERSAFGLTPLAVIPGRTGADGVSHPQVPEQPPPVAPSANTYQGLRSAIRLLAVDRPLRSIQVTSASMSEGKTETAAGLALALARTDGAKVVVVDCNLWSAGLHTLFGLRNDVGLTSLISGEATLSEAVQVVSDSDGLSVLSAGPRPPNTPDLLSTESARRVLARLSSEGNVVVLDSPPVLGTSDAIVLSANVDGTLLVVRAGVSSRQEVHSAVDMLQQVGAPVLGTVLHAVPSREAAPSPDPMPSRWPEAVIRRIPGAPQTVRAGTDGRAGDTDGSAQHRTAEESEEAEAHDVAVPATSKGTASGGQSGPLPPSRRSQSPGRRRRKNRKKPKR